MEIVMRTRELGMSAHPTVALNPQLNLDRRRICPRDHSRQPPYPGAEGESQRGRLTVTAHPEDCPID